MGMRLERCREEIVELIETAHSEFREIFVENRPRWRNPKEWSHLAVDPCVSLFAILKAAVMPYLMGHMLALYIAWRAVMFALSGVGVI